MVCGEHVLPLYRGTLTSLIPVGAEKGGSSGGKDVCYGLYGSLGGFSEGAKSCHQVS